MKLEKTVTTKLEKDVYEEILKMANHAAIKVGTQVRVLLNNIVKKGK